MRRRLAVLLAATGSLLWIASPAGAAQPFVPRAVDFEQPLGLELSRSGGELRSGVIRAPKRFDLVGLKWSGPEHPHVQIRVRDAAGEWSPWTAMGDQHAGGQGTEPVWAGGADALQLRMDRAPRGLRAHFVNATGTATAADRARTALHGARASALGDVRAESTRSRAAAPAIVPRAAWGADQCPPRTTPGYGEIQAGFVHHTVSANAYGPEDGPAMVLAICRYHRNSNGWNDIGYNFLVDRYGRVYEGRSGGVDRPVIGAQTQGYNSVSTGVANIGTFTSVAQTPQAIRATAQLLAWKLSLHGVPVSGRVTVTSGGGASNRFPAGMPVGFERIAGHRDANATECPGGALYGQLGEIRAQAAALAPQLGGSVSGGLTLRAVDRTLAFPQAALLQGRLTGPDGAPLGAAKVSLQIAGGSGFYTARSARTGADGAWSATLATAYSRTLRAVSLRSDGRLVTSRQLRVGVAPRIRVRATRRVGARRRFTVSGSIGPRRERVTLEVQRKGAAGKMRTIARLRVKVRSGRFAARLRLRRAGLHRLRAVFRADARNSFASSPRRYVRVVRRGRSR
ncbi:MAG: N-acetylmuramoyl-L-alanine amidase [Actinomycetota bacterium]|nr:N-acetylmuramoyl-L-alanine amidase [Actinomycetota bacterium]